MYIYIYICVSLSLYIYIYILLWNPEWTKTYDLLRNEQIINMCLSVLFKCVSSPGAGGWVTAQSPMLRRGRPHAATFGCECPRPQIRLFRRS